MVGPHFAFGAFAFLARESAQGGGLRAFGV